MLETLVGIGATITLALLAYLIKGMLAVGHLAEEVANVSRKTDSTAAVVADIQKTMLRPADLENAVLKLKLEVMRDAIATGTRTTDKS